MYYSAYHSIDVINGEGNRCTLFVSGCEHACKGCYNQSTWRVDAGHVFSQALEDQILNDLTDSRIFRRGLSLSGGDPLHPANLEAILKLVMRVKDECPEKDIWLWTGYQLADLSEQQQTVVNLVDVMIDGKFEQDKADPALLWRGSSNQQVYRFNR
ncbi:MULTISPECIES: anaerobic ribonucleoside-triphosphate reductase-activating protein [Shewanella]|uniref:Anaerobic ribonucleoside-triphosphate reductase-activating protein n=1 Tax=Shewanella psychromarinicola TaxID=2487742 RepID=A0A3N4EM21_9GAMM|nr:anaerobic ribonucleoside-triphosphate reductase-activating protein [Shewanella psychromarinicola]AZG36758.1 anaerobic ribonucleoside-triphosphate reductase-activating protein [Shewanella psychromarinicola]MCL1081960.1 anaerobic ribonucleoside-triphosphate reductase-activating protein [Shewanella psychromarinicola]RPA34611.1 anaerobic ribonucleoside-triphosphate reductase-activating protein [Shewanella psychromarinicola]